MKTFTPPSRDDLFRRTKELYATQITLEAKAEQAKQKLDVMLRNAPDPYWQRAIIEVIEELS